MMADTPHIAAMKELVRRGKLPEDMRPFYEEAVKRGLIDVPRGPEPGIDTLPIPGTFDPARDTPSPNLSFGLTQSDTLNPLPMLNALGNNIASNIPIAGPYLKKAGENVDAWVDNNVYRPLMGKPGTTTPEDVAATNAEDARQNPIAAETGKVVGAVAPYALAAEVPVLQGAMGFTGPTLQRLAMTAASQEAINTGDNMAHGDDFPTAAGKAVMPSLLSAPFALLGPAQKLTGARGEAVKILEREGVPLSGGQARGSKALMTAESALGGLAAQNFQDKQLQAFTKAALKYAGVTADNAGPEVMNKALQRAGDKFDSLAARTNIKFDSTLQNDLLGIVQNYQQVTGAPAPAVENMMNRIASIAQMNGGDIPGESYKVLSTDLGELIKGSSSEVQQALKGVKEAVDDAVERSASGPLLDEWRKTRTQYKNLMDIMTAVSTSSADAASGLVRPVALRNAISSGAKKRSYAKGAGDLNELARAGVIAMTPIPDSGTAGRAAALMATGGAGASLASFGGNGGAALAAGAASMAAPWLTGRAMMSGAGRDFLAGKGSTVPSTVARGTFPFLLP